MKLRISANSLISAGLAIVSIFMVAPLLIMIFTSLKGDTELANAAGSLLPKNWKFENYILAMQTGQWGTYFKNSIIVTVFAVGGSLIFNSLSGYTFARVSFKFRNIIFVALLLGLMVPPQVTILTQFIMLKSVPLFGGNDIFGHGGQGWLDSYYALIIPELSGSLGIFLARQYYLGFPKDMDEAASIDGSGIFRSFWKIYLPLSGPLLATLGILKTVHVWNDFFHPLVYTNSEAMRTIQLGLQVFHGQYEIKFNLLMAASVVVSLPLCIAFFFFQRHFVQSLISTSVKG
ncbi:carbohydrate ABC transporter permease [Paenibacillus alkaliterrae]|uniref:carbohydrate ABC transporter permease n=1 Tax=Paenibacillus alkaliterrae TaxID=320909 RepID=UPI001F30B28F|nr:carbohydrate ABC transporter permease [Paenibacillus alkaliterrae]MCF2939476.1 carbohydrate ABC transporter permease [Paenibacillus alkaliterrae]